METPPAPTKVEKINVDDIEVATENVRIEDPRGGLTELKESILRHGLLQPITVYPIGKNEYRILLGQRRYLAWKDLRERLGNFIPAIVVDPPKDHAEGVAISAIENLQRRDLTFKERTTAITALLQQLGSPKKVAETLGLSDQTISKWLKYEDIVPPEIKEIVERQDGSLTRDQAVAIVAANYPNSDRAIALVREMLRKAPKPTKYQKDRIAKRSKRDKVSAPERIVEEELPKAEELKITFHLAEQYASGMRNAAKDVAEDDDIDEAARVIVEDYLENEGYTK